MKAIVKTKPGTMLLEVSHSQEVPDGRPAVVLLTYFIHQHIGFGSLKSLAGDLPDEASDAEFAEFWKECDGNEELAVQSYMSKLSGLVEGEPAPFPEQFPLSEKLQKQLEEIVNKTDTEEVKEVVEETTQLESESEPEPEPEPEPKE